MEILKTLIIIIVPTTAVFLTSYFMLKSLMETTKKFIEQEENKKKLELRAKNSENSLPLRLQAYERLTLFLERIEFENLLPRVQVRDFNTYEYQNLLIQTIRQEFEHNLSQQLYVSSNAWELIKNAKEDSISIINGASANVKQDAHARELVSAIFEITLKKSKSMPQQALDVLKKEIKTLF